MRRTETIEGNKLFEIRKNDRNFQVGDVLLLKEWDNIKYTGREVGAMVRYILDALLVHPATEYVRNFIFDYSSGDAVVSFIVKGAQWEEEETISTVFEKGVS